MKNRILMAFSLIACGVNAQDTSNVKKQIEPNPLTFSGYIETYFSYDLGNPSNHERPAFVYNFNRHNEVNLNLGFVKAAYAKNNVRGNLALMTGTYAQYNLAGEQGLLKNVFEANVGFKVSKTKNLWVDAGIMPSHIGFESAIGKDCWNLTRSLLADNTPYYESGVKLGFTSKNEKVYLAAMYLNGWQRIQRIASNQTPALGTQLTYKPNSKATLNWSTFVGNEQPDTLKKWRVFNNLYGQFQLTNKIHLIAGLDYGMQQDRDTNDVLDGMSNWVTPIAIVRFSPSNKTRLAIRGEYYSDKSGIIIATGTPNGFQTVGYSVNFDLLPAENVMFRIEARGFQSKDEVFIKENKPSNSNFFITSSLAISF